MVRCYRTLLLIGIVSWFAACNGNGSGTEVVNTPNPNANPGSTKIYTNYYDFDITLPTGWTMILYDSTTLPGDEAFTDSDPATDNVATFIAGDNGYFTVFASQLNTGETLEEFVRARRPTGEIQSETETADNGTMVTIDLYQQETAGARGGTVFDVYILVDPDLLWMRCELLGSAKEQEATWNDFWDMVATIKFN